MNLKLKRLVRTSSSEQYALFDLEQFWRGDGEPAQDVEMPLTIGKLDLHYTPEGVYGTLLLWDDAARELEPAVRQSLIAALLDEIAQPMGVPSEYVIEFFSPTLEYYEVFHNVGVDQHNPAGSNGEDEEQESAESTTHRTRRLAQAPS